MYWTFVQLGLDLVAEKMLNIVGYNIQDSFDNMGVIDWDIWPKTIEAIKAFQTAVGIESDWYAGPQFFAHLVSLLKWDKSYVYNIKVSGIDNYTYSVVGGDLDNFIVSDDGKNGNNWSETNLEWNTEISEISEDTNIFEIEKSPMKEIMQKIKEVSSWDNVYPVSIDDKNQINFVSTNWLNDYTNYITLTYNYKSNKVEKSNIKYLSYDSYKKLADEIDLTIDDLKDVWWMDYKLFQSVANEYTKIRRKKNGTRMYVKTMKNKAIENAWWWLVDLVWSIDARDVVERATNKDNWKEFIKWGEKQSSLWNKHTTLKDWLLYKTVVWEDVYVGNAAIVANAGKTSGKKVQDKLNNKLT